MQISNFVDSVFIDVIKTIYELDNVNVFFGDSLQDIKLVISDNNCRKHEVLVSYRDVRKYVVTFTTVPFISYEDVEYPSLKDVLTTYCDFLNDLSHYFYELDQIDSMCCIVDPVKPTYKENYRKILLDNRTWLHIGVSADGTACNLHLIGHNQDWNAKLQSGLQHWDHDIDIVQNIKNVFDITTTPPSVIDRSENQGTNNSCGICLCFDLENTIPQPLCPNKNCGVYFHRGCLYQWLLACLGGRSPALGVIVGACPACSEQISCSENED